MGKRKQKPARVTSANNVEESRKAPHANRCPADTQKRNGTAGRIEVVTLKRPIVENEEPRTVKLVCVRPVIEDAEPRTVKLVCVSSEGAERKESAIRVPTEKEAADREVMASVDDAKGRVQQHHNSRPKRRRSPTS